MKTSITTETGSSSRWRRVLARLNAAMAVAAWCSYGPRTWRMDDRALRLLTKRETPQPSRPPVRETRELAPPVMSCCAVCCR